jgi:hypothetical protein
MKKNGIVLIAVLSVVAIAITLLLPPATPSADEYKAEVFKQRADKDTFMRNNAASPFAKAPNAFAGLKYFDPDLQYRVTARLEKIDHKKVVVLPTSDGMEKRYLEFAHATFTLHGASHRLLILEVMDPGPFRGTLFLAFADETSARETYGAGRYLDIKKIPGATSAVLDFNLAYNPYCAYTDEFSCPLPPRENILRVPIRAGEKVYK